LIAEKERRAEQQEQEGGAETHGGFPGWMGGSFWRCNFDLGCDVRRAVKME
jgi:hypothetical protein